MAPPESGAVAHLSRGAAGNTSWRHLWKAAVLVAVESIAVKARSNRWQTVSWQDPIIWNITIIVLTEKGINKNNICLVVY